MSRRTVISFMHRGRRYRARMRRAPFREGEELIVRVDSFSLSVPERGLGKRAALSKARAEIDNYLFVLN